MKSLIIISCCLLFVTCKTSVQYEVNYKPIEVPEEAKKIVIAASRQKMEDESKLSKKQKRELEFNLATKAYMIEEIKYRFSRDNNFLSVSDTTYEGQTQSFIEYFDSTVLVLVPDLNITKSDGFTISSDEDNENYSTYYGALNTFVYNAGKLMTRINLNETTEVEGSDLVLVIELISSERVKFSPEIERMLGRLAIDLHNRWYPRTEKRDKSVYLGKKFKGFDKYFNAQAYDKAEAVISPYLNSANLSLQMKASYNMHVLCEAQGDIDCAANWLNNFNRCRDELNSQYEK